GDAVRKVLREPGAEGTGEGVSEETTTLDVDVVENRSELGGPTVRVIRGSDSLAGAVVRGRGDDDAELVAHGVDDRRPPRVVALRGKQRRPGAHDAPHHSSPLDEQLCHDAEANGLAHFAGLGGSCRPVVREFTRTRLDAESRRTP